MVKQREVITFVDLLGKETKVRLPQGARVSDLKDLNEIDEAILKELKVHGRHSRYWFSKRGMTSAIHRLKSRMLIEAIRVGNNYSYGLTSLGHLYVNQFYSGVTSMDLIQMRHEKGKTGMFC